MSFIPLRVFSGYSFTKSGLKIDQYLSAAKKLGYTTVGLGDFTTLSGAPSFYKEAKALGLNQLWEKNSSSITSFLIYIQLAKTDTRI